MQYQNLQFDKMYIEYEQWNKYMTIYLFKIAWKYLLLIIYDNSTWEKHKM